MSRPVLRALVWSSLVGVIAQLVLATAALAKAGAGGSWLGTVVTRGTGGGGFPFLPL